LVRWQTHLEKRLTCVNFAYTPSLGERGRLSKLMKSIPVFAVIPEDLGIRGACVCAKKVRSIYKENIKYCKQLMNINSSGAFQK